MSPELTFSLGILILILFGWYFATDIPRRKRWLGLTLSALLIALCLEAIIPPEKKIQLGLDLKGGASFLIRLVAQEGEQITPDLQEQAVEVIRKRVDAYGGSEPLIAPQGTERVLVQLPGLEKPEDIEKTKAALQRVAKLELASVLPATPELIARYQSGDEVLNPAYVLKEYNHVFKGEKVSETLVIKRRAELSGDHLTSAHAYYQQEYGVSLSLDAEGAKIFGHMTEEAYRTGGRIAILLDGEVQSAPGVTNGAIYGGNAQITGNFTDKEARDLASALENPLRVPVQIEEVRIVSASLGADAIRSGVLAGVSGLVLVFAFVMVYYRMAGLVAFLGLIVNIILLFGMMAMFHFVLTLPGIAGIILTIGMAVDANVLIYERLREETAAGKSLVAALEGAYDKAFSAIFDANVTTLITSVILFWQATGSVRGFAVTLTLGIIASMFAALLVTRTTFRWAIEKFGLKKLTMLDLIPKRQFDFLGKRRLAAIVSAVLILGSIGLFAVRGEKNFGIDFRGGDLLVVDSARPLSMEEARGTLAEIGLGDSAIQFERAGTRDLLSFRSPEGTSDKIMEALKSSFPDSGVFQVSQENVGPQIGMEFARRAAWALLLGMLGILVYVTIRFEFSFALATVVALLHDVIITMGLFSLIGGELSLVMVGAILTVAGYSVNDTIVVFDRVRERLKQGEGGSIQALMNSAINQTLGRTILTGGTTLLSVGALYFFGGAVLRDFSFAILAGILVGTFSSIFIAAPIVLWWTRFAGKSIRREVMEREALNRA